MHLPGAIHRKRSPDEAPEMIRRAMCLAACLLGLASWRAVAAEGADEPVLFDKAEGTRVSERLGQDARMKAVFERCPADAFQSRRPFWRRFIEASAPFEKTCARHPLDCYSQCTTWSNEKACFDLALAFEHHSLDVTVIDKEKLYALACATGNGQRLHEPRGRHPQRRLRRRSVP